MKNILGYLKNNRIILSVLFGLGGILFILLFLDSHYKNLANAKTTSVSTSSNVF
jgi:hypothetical protein